jgi:predicted nucleotidyltransferase
MSKSLREYANKNCILEVRTGSHLYGTNTPKSDKDYVGIFLPPKEYIIGLKCVNEIDLSITSKGKDGKNTADAIDRKMYEYRKFVNLALGSNPNILEILFVNKENILHFNKHGKKLLSIRHCFPSQLCVLKFLGYARSQKHKMVIRSDKFNDLKYGLGLLKTLPDKMVMVEVIKERQNKMRTIQNDVSSSMVPCFVRRQQYIKCGDINLEVGIYVKKARKILKERIDKATNRRDLILKHGFDSKFGAHLIRLLCECKTLMETRKLEFPLPESNMLKKIINGEWEVGKVTEMATHLEDEIIKAQETTTLPKTPDYQQVEKMVINTNLTWLNMTPH